MAAAAAATAVALLSEVKSTEVLLEDGTSPRVTVEVLLAARAEGPACNEPSEASLEEPAIIAAAAASATAEYCLSHFAAEVVAATAAAERVAARAAVGTEAALHTGAA